VSDSGRKTVVSLVPSITETLLAWGVTPVAVTRFCEAPGVRAVGGTKNPDIAAIVALEPDVVLMDQEENRREDADALGAAGVTVRATRVRSVADVGPALAELAEAIDVDVPTQPRIQAGRPRAEARVRAWVPIWRRPWMSIGAATYGTSLLAAAGIDHVYSADPAPYPLSEPGDAAARRPDVVLAPSEPYPWKERHRAELQQVGPVEFVDGQDLFWWGARTADALRRLQKLATTLRPQ
jgi:ABC-type Fe3+-hydroxamate transport system substrate-binding protein